MNWTHAFDLLAKLTAIGVGFVAGFVGLCLFPPPLDRALLWLVFAAGGAAWWLVLRPLSSWLHARVRLGVRLSWSQARRASILFSPVRDTTRWHPMWEVRDLPINTRAAAIEDTINLHETEQKAETARLLTARTVTSRWIPWAKLGVVLVVSMGRFPPASWAYALQERIFNGTSYPLFNLIIVGFPLAGVLNWLENAIASRSAPTSAVPPQRREIEAP